MEHCARTQLDQTIDSIQQRWGRRALFRGDGSLPGMGLPMLSTGHARLDRALSTGGIPQGRITELVGSGSSGQVSLAGSLLAGAQRQGQQVAYVDVEHRVDLETLAHRGVSFESLAILRPLSFPHAVEMTRDLIAAGGAGAVVFDRLHDYQAGSRTDQERPESDFDLLDRALREWSTLLSRSLCALVFITEVTSLATYPPDLSLPYFATLRLGMAWDSWILARADREWAAAAHPTPPEEGCPAAVPRHIVGFCSRVTVLKNKLGPAGQSVSLSMQVFER